MRGLAATTANLAKLRKQWARAVEDKAGPDLGDGAGAPSRLTEVTGFGSNPGQLRMLAYVPDRLPPAPALVVVLHGCTQAAAGYDRGSGWSALADRHGFVVVYPQQVSANNQKSCFNWFQPEDIGRGVGEALSIREMVERAATDHGVDRGRIFVTGLSAGGAMAAVMLATYPDVFAAGAVIAGLPYGGARNVQEALTGMFQGRARPSAEWGDLVRGASRHAGAWPRLSVWHGSADRTVVPGNADELVKQWRNLHGLPATPSRREAESGFTRDVWQNASGTDVVESVRIAGMGHGTPIGAGEGAAAPFMLDTGIPSSSHIARFWGLVADVPARAANNAPSPMPDGVVRLPRPAPKLTQSPDQGQVLPAMGSIAETINNALRSAGLLKR
jgi:feruloyl esterase